MIGWWTDAPCVSPLPTLQATTTRSQVLAPLGPNMSPYMEEEPKQKQDPQQEQQQPKETQEQTQETGKNEHQEHCLETHDQEPDEQDKETQLQAEQDHEEEGDEGEEDWEMESRHIPDWEHFFSTLTLTDNQDGIVGRVLGDGSEQCALGSAVAAEIVHVPCGWLPVAQSDQDSVARVVGAEDIGATDNDLDPGVSQAMAEEDEEVEVLYPGRFFLYAAKQIDSELLATPQTLNRPNGSLIQQSDEVMTMSLADLHKLGGVVL